MKGWLVFYVEGESTNPESPATFGGDLIPSARNAREALKKSQNIDKIDGEAFVVRLEDCERFKQVTEWRKS
jgi:hypothetical protein